MTSQTDAFIYILFNWIKTSQLGITYSLFMLTKGSVDHAHVEQNLGGVGNLLELAQCLVEFIVVVPREGGDPSFYFLWWLSVNAGSGGV